MTHPVGLQRLHPPGRTVTVRELVDEIAWGTPSRERRPWVVLNMVASADGRVTVEGRSGALSNEADRQLFHELRAAVDAVMVGAGTLRAEGYGRLVKTDDLRATRVARGLEPEPLAVIASASLNLPADLALLAEPTTRAIVITAATGELPGVSAEVEYVRPTVGAQPDLAAALAQLHSRGVRSLLCEGGPHLNGLLLQAGLVDEIFLSLSPQLVGGDGPALVEGASLTPPWNLQLIWLLEYEGQLFARYSASV